MLSHAKMTVNNARNELRHCALVLSIAQMTSPLLYEASFSVTLNHSQEESRGHPISRSIKTRASVSHEKLET